MLKENLSPKHILVDLLSIQCQLPDFFKNDEQYKPIIDFLNSKDYYNDPDIPYPTLKEAEKETGLSATKLRKYTVEMYNRIFDFESNDCLKFPKAEYSFYMKHYDLHAQFTLKHLNHIPRVGEELSLVKEKMNTSHFYVDNVYHDFDNDVQRVSIWLKGGSYNSWWKLRKDEALQKREISPLDQYTMHEYQIKEQLGLPPY
jgi:hypothetical protein